MSLLIFVPLSLEPYLFAEVDYYLHSINQRQGYLLLDGQQYSVLNFFLQSVVIVGGKDMRRPCNVALL